MPFVGRTGMQHRAHVLLLCGEDDVPPGLRRWIG
jgi:hypothetical protein